MGSLWGLGITLGVLASMSGTAGKQLLRFSELTRRRGTKSAICASKVAMGVGLALNTVIGPLVDMVSYAFAPQSLIAPLGGLDVVWNTLTAPCTLGEKLTRSPILGCILIFGGALATSLVGSREEPDFTLESIQELLMRPTVGIYLLALAAWLAFNIVFLMPRPAGDSLRGLSLGMTAGSIAGNMFCVKAFVELVQSSFRDETVETWKHWLPYVVLVGAIFFAVSNLYFLTKAMREYEALFMGAVFEGSLIISACLSGCVVFSELESLQAWQIAVYWLAILSIVAGIGSVVIGVARKTPSTVDAETAKGSMEGTGKVGREGQKIDGIVATIGRVDDATAASAGAWSPGVVAAAEPEAGGWAAGRRGARYAAQPPAATSAGAGYKRFFSEYGYGCGLCWLARMFRS